jgi:hypothetical protein
MPPGLGTPQGPGLPLAPGPQPPPGTYPPPEFRPAPARPQRPSRPAAPPRRELRQQALAASVFGLLGLLALTAANQAGHALYLVVFALVIGAAGCVLGISAGRRARREATMRPRGSVAAIVLGAVTIVLSLFAIIGIAYSQQLTTYEQCMKNATTTAAQQACTHQLMHAVQSR